MEPFEVLGAPYQIYLAPVGTAFPEIDAEPADPWDLLGTSGYLNYDDDGISVEHNQTLTDWTPAGSTTARKVFRTKEEFKLTVKLVDLSPVQYAKVINNATVTVTPAGPTQAAEASFSLSRGLTIATFALLCRGLSPEGDAFNAQFEVTTVYEDGSPKPTFKKGVPAILDCSFMALADDDGEIGFFRSQRGAHS